MSTPHKQNQRVRWLVGYFGESLFYKNEI